MMFSIDTLFRVFVSKATGVVIEIVVALLVAGCVGYLVYSYTNSWVLAGFGGVALVAFERRVFAWRLRQELS